MSTTHLALSGQYALATGADAVGRLDVLHGIYSPMGQRVLIEAGLTKNMRVADFGCGTGNMTRMLAAMVGPLGSVTGIDLHGAQVEQAQAMCAREGLNNTEFVHADACNTGLPPNQFDLVYCRFLLLHLPDPAACLKEMRRVLRPGGILVVEDGDLASAGSAPVTALYAFAHLFGRLGSVRGLDYSLASRLCELVAAAGFSEISLKVHQPSHRAGPSGVLLQWSVEEAGPSFIEAGLITRDQLSQTLSAMRGAAADPSVLALAPRMSLVWGQKKAA
jgi:ubiquinone/menaquinone biosynthesis C-methylase UbiE